MVASQLLFPKDSFHLLYISVTVGDTGIERAEHRGEGLIGDRC
jgi:hypothetical protein